MTPLDSFPACLAFVLGAEGGWSDDPRDNGHETMKGITLATFRAWEGDPTITADDLRAIDDLTVAEIYRNQYWDRVAGDNLPHGVNLMVFDLAVNAGPGRSVRMLQAAVHAGQDGWVGPLTLDLVAKVDRARLINALAAARLGYYRSLSAFGTFGHGWTRRTDECMRAALAMK